MSVDKHDTRSLVLSEIKLAQALIDIEVITGEQFEDFLETRRKFDRDGRRYLGEILIKREVITETLLNEFIAESDVLQTRFLDYLVRKGYIKDDTKENIIEKKKAGVNLISAVEQLGVMTRENYYRMFSKQVTSMKLGEWLMDKGLLDEHTLKKALEEQSINNFEDFLIYHEILSEDELDEVKFELNLF